MVYYEINFSIFRRFLMQTQMDYRKIDLMVVYIANVINIIMSFLFMARISTLPPLEHALGISTIILGFSLGYIAIINKKNKRDKWDLIPIFVFFIVELILDYILLITREEMKELRNI